MFQLYQVVAIEDLVSRSGVASHCHHTQASVNANASARAPAGLAIQTKAATLACQDLWDTKGETEASLDVERVFIEAVCRYSGIAVPAKR